MKVLDAELSPGMTDYRDGADAVQNDRRVRIATPGLEHTTPRRVRAVQRTEASRLGLVNPT